MSIQGRRVAPQFSQPTNQPHRSGRRSPSRHGCLTTWLVLAMFGAGVGFLQLVLLPIVDVGHEGPLTWLESLLLGLTVLISLIGVVALFMWRKWGFHCIIVGQVLATAVLIWMQLHFAYWLKEWMSVIILYGLLHLGGHRKAWDRLR